MDYIGEAGIGKPLQVPISRKLPDGIIRMGLFYRASWPVFNAYCGDLDLIGNPKAAHYYKIWFGEIVILKCLFTMRLQTV